LMLVAAICGTAGAVLGALLDWWRQPMGRTRAAPAVATGQPALRG
jgi:hypothetical protein